MHKVKITIRKKEPVPLELTQGLTPPPLSQNITISFDIGIINLAYCIMSYCSDNDSFDISDAKEHWGIIKLVDGDPKMRCSSTLKGKGVCKNKAHYRTGNPGSYRGWCRVHAPAVETNNLQRNMTVDNVTEWELKTKLFKTLDSDDKFLHVNSIVIETQPLKAREKIKGIGHAIFDYYALRGMDHAITYKELKFIDAKNKLTVYTGPPLSCHLKTQYARNKWYSVRYCQWILRNHPQLLQRFNSASKQDDLADCFLQGLWYLKFHCTNKKPDMTSAHQKLVNNENNKLQYGKVRAHAPQKKQLSSGRYTLSNIKYLVGHGHNPGSNPSLKSSIEYYFGSVSYFEEEVRNG